MDIGKALDVAVQGSSSSVGGAVEKFPCFDVTMKKMSMIGGKWVSIDCVYSGLGEKLAN